MYKMQSAVGGLRLCHAKGGQRPKEVGFGANPQLLNKKIKNTLNNLLIVFEQVYYKL